MLLRTTNFHLQSRSVLLFSEVLTSKDLFGFFWRGTVLLGVSGREKSTKEGKKPHTSSYCKGAPSVLQAAKGDPHSTLRSQSLLTILWKMSFSCHSRVFCLRFLTEITARYSSVAQIVISMNYLRMSMNKAINKMEFKTDKDWKPL